MKRNIAETVSLISIAANALLAALKVTVGYLFGSTALIGDGIDSTGDILASAITFVSVKIAVSPPDREHPWGHGRAEAVGVKLLSFIMFFAGAQLFLSAFRDLLDPRPRVMPETPALIAAAVSIAAKTALAVLLHRIGKKHRSPSLRANAQNMRGDIVLSLSVLAGLALTFLFGVPVIDSIMTLAVSVWIMRGAVALFIDNARQIMDGVEDAEIYARLFDAVESVNGVENPHRARIRETGGRYDIVLDIEVDGSISVADSHRLAGRVEAEVGKTLPELFDIVVHVEPKKEGEHAEGYGLSRKLLGESPEKS